MNKAIKFKRDTMLKAMLTQLIRLGSSRASPNVPLTNN